MLPSNVIYVLQCLNNLMNFLLVKIKLQSKTLVRYATPTCTTHLLIGSVTTLRAGLHYGGEVHRS